MNLLVTLKKRLQELVPTLELREQEPMSAHTSFKIGGPVSLMAFPKNQTEAVIAAQAAAEEGASTFFLGKGSNLLVSDQGFAGFIIKTSGLDRVTEVNGHLCAESGIPLSRLANAALNRSLTGLEFAHGIPGSLGGAVVMNAGAYGGEMVQVLHSVTFLNRSGEIETVPAETCQFSYRHSIFSDRPECMILEAKLALAPGNAAEIKSKMDDLAVKRRAKQPLEYPSGGSTFKRPEGHFAAALIEQCGLKGLGIGGAQVSEKHAGFIINRGGATYTDVVALMERVRCEVFRQTGVVLEPELKQIGG